MKRFLVPSSKVVFGVALLSASLLLGCSRNSRPIPGMFGAARGYGSGSVTVTIQNQDFKDATIYANWAGMARHRVGLAVGKTSKTFIIEWRSEVVQFDADFIAGRTFAFEPISVYEGDHLDLIIMNEG
jgi:hypothetical protein